MLGRGVIADRQTIALDLDEVSTDLDDLHRATDDNAVVAAYTGEFLPEDAFEDWSAPARDEARARFVAAARRVVAAALEGGDKDVIETKTQALAEASSKLAEKAYSASADEGGPEPVDANASAQSESADDVVDAEFEEVKEDDKK